MWHWGLSSKFLSLLNSWGFLSSPWGEEHMVWLFQECCCTEMLGFLGWVGWVFFRHLSAVLWGGWLTLSEVLKEEIIYFNHSWHNCWSVLSREKKSKRYFKGEKRPFQTLFSCLYFFLCLNGNYSWLLTVSSSVHLPPHHCDALLDVFHHPFPSCSSLAPAASGLVSFAGAGTCLQQSGFQSAQGAQNTSTNCSRVRAKVLSLTWGTRSVIALQVKMKYL